MNNISDTAELEQAVTETNADFPWLWDTYPDPDDNTGMPFGADPDRYDQIERGIDCCGKHWEEFVRYDGTPGHVPFRCGHFHGEYGLFCPKCVERRAQEHLKRIEYAVRRLTFDDYVVRMNIIEPEVSKRLMRKYGKDHVMICPLQDGRNMVFWWTQVTDESYSGTILDLELLGTIDWVASAKTPKGKKRSGKLGHEAVDTDWDDDDDDDDDDEEDDEEEENDDKNDRGAKSDDEKEKPTMIPQRRVIVTGVDATKRRKAWEEAVLETIDLDPRTPTELGDAMEQRMSAYVTAVTRRGGNVIYSHVINRKVKSSDIVPWDNLRILKYGINVPPDTPPYDPIHM